MRKTITCSFYAYLRVIFNTNFGNRLALSDQKKLTQNEFRNQPIKIT